MKFTVTREHDFSALEKYLYPARQFCEEKIRKGMYDDWNEYEHTAHWLKDILSSGQNDRLIIYYLQEDEQIIGCAFALIDSPVTRESLKKDGIIPGTGRIAHLTCIHILEAYRGKGRGAAWLTGEIFDDLRSREVTQVYIKSSHHSALSLYEKLGTKIGNYISVSDSRLYQRYGYIYRIDL